MARISPALFAKQVRQEALKVTWPTRKETTLSTVMVLAMVVFAAVFFFVVDELLAVLVRQFLGFGA